VVEVLQPERNLSYNPIFQVMFSVIKAAVQSHAFGNLTAYPYVVTPNTSILDLSMTIIEGVDGHWWAQMDYNTELFRSEDVAGILANYTNLLEAIIADPEKRILDFPVSEAVAHRLAETSSSLPMRAERKSAAVAQTLCRSKLQRPAERLEPEEKLLVEIWKNLLRMPEIGIDDNFFDIGGHSLLAAQLIAQVQSSTKRKVAVSAIFRAPTIRAFAKLLKDDALAKPDPLLMRLHEGNHPISFFAVAAPGVDTFGFAQLARHLPTDQSLYKLQASDSIVLGRPRTAEEMQALCNRYISAMRSAQPRGPYCLGAMCGGVWIAQQMILQLESEDEEVALFTIFDTWVVENSQIRSLWALDYYLQRLRNMRALPFHQQLATVRRVFGRITALSNANRKRGWGDAFWPGKDFQPPQFQAPVLLFKRPRQPYFYIRDPQMGWGTRSNGGVETCEIHCGHVEMFR
jgi:thioesterase domain-containing protein